MTIHFLFASSVLFSPRSGFPPLTPPVALLLPPCPVAVPPFSRPPSPPAVPTEPEPTPEEEFESFSREERDFFLPRQQLRKQRKLDEDFLRLDSGRKAKVSMLGGTMVVREEAVAVFQATDSLLIQSWHGGILGFNKTKHQPWFLEWTWHYSIYVQYI